MGSSLNPRSWQLLKLLIERYIADGQPVGSKVLACESGLSLSSATIRGILAELERSGYLFSPHTSAGRVPTEQGYRLFVDHLLTTHDKMLPDMESLSSRLNTRQGTTEVLKSASELVSEVTQMAGLVSIPTENQRNLDRIEFIALSQNRVLVILVFHGNDVQNRILHTQENYSPAELQQATNLINHEFVGKSLAEIRISLLESMQRDRHTMNRLMQRAIEMATQALSTEQEGEYVVSGQDQLLNIAERTSVDRLQALFETFKQKQAMLDLLSRCIQSDSLQIFIGKEAGHEVFEDFSIVTSPYTVDGEVLGVLGVIGPTRMLYERVISTVNVTAKLLSETLQG